MIQTKWEKKGKVSQKEIPSDWESEETKKRIRVREKMKTPEERKTKYKNLSKNMFLEKIQIINKMKK